MRAIYFSILFSGLVVGLSGCGSGGLAAVRAKAAADMKCDAGKLTLTPDRPGLNVFTVEGCDQIGRYSATCNMGGYCPTVGGQIVSTMLRKQAAFDLKCGDAEVQLSILNTETFGARGCGRQASYIVVCEYGNCKAVQNTQTQ